MNNKNYKIIETESCNWAKRKRLSMRVVLDESVSEIEVEALLASIGERTREERNQDAIMVFGYRSSDNTSGACRWRSVIGDWEGADA